MKQEGRAENKVPMDFDETSDTRQDTTTMMMDDACEPALSIASSTSFSYLDRLHTGSIVFNTQGSDDKADHQHSSVTTNDLVLDEAEREAIRIFWIRNLLVVALIAATSVAALFISKVTRNCQEEQFHTHFEDTAAHLINSFEDNLVATIAALDGAATMAAVTTTQKTGWPFIVVPDFEIFGASSRSLAGAGLLAIVPMVPESSRVSWEAFVVNNTDWIEEGLEQEEKVSSEGRGSLERDGSRRDLQTSNIDLSSGIATTIFKTNGENYTLVVDDTDGPYFPIWQSTPVCEELVNYNLLTHTTSGDDLRRVMESGQIVMGEGVNVSNENDPLNILFRPTEVWESVQNTTFLGTNESAQEGLILGDPVSMVYFPLYDTLDVSRTMVGTMVASIYWSDYLRNILPSDSGQFVAVLENDCGQAFTYVISGGQVLLYGEGDLHDAKYDNLSVEFHFSDISAWEDEHHLVSNIRLDVDYCAHRLTTYPTMELEESFVTGSKVVYSFFVIVSFVFAAVIFVLYDRLVTIRQKRIARRAAETTAVVNSLFPANVRGRLFNNERPKEMDIRKPNPMFDTQLKGHCLYNSLPIADLFPRATVMFADIAGFTAWSSSREPTQVFLMLETIYGKFDVLAKQHTVFKVETIGDCYVAATGVPETQHDHALRMANFARACLERITELTKELESSLGPETGNLQMRFGLHSGPVTAGVLRGEKSRFQLFGDTVNTASRMESTGLPGRIQCSETTGDLLREAGEGHRLIEREETVHAKGKGAIRTFWVLCADETSSQSNNGLENGYSYFADEETIDFVLQQRKKKQANTNARLARLIEWNVDVLHRQLRNLMVSRDPSTVVEGFTPPMGSSRTLPIGDVKEAVAMPPPNISSPIQDPPELNPQALSQLREYVKTIAHMYHNTNAFHNFDHSAHVSLSAQKLLSRIVTSTSPEERDEHGSNTFAYGITSDPLTHFAILFSTMIHDVDHSGISNNQLITENSDLARLYKNKSIAEQNSIDIAWELLMEPAFDALRSCIFANQGEHDRFRSLVVNSVIATDIFDKELKAFRQKRWDKAFANVVPVDSESSSPVAIDSGRDLKATIVIEHLIQASDVSHTMQHWHVYQSWNEKLFAEMYKAYKNGRMEKNPADGWYEGELAFFDHYVIPLAKKLFDCGVFGVSSDEYLQYAMENRGEWAFKGKTLVSRWVEKYKHRK